jgi:hypothetical protein
MTTTSRTPLSLVTRCLFAVAVSGCLLAQVPGGTPAKPVPDPEVAQKVEQLTKIAKDKKFAEDARGRELIDALMVKQQKGMMDKDEAMVVKCLDTVLNKNKVRPVNNSVLYNAAIEALGRHGAEGAKVLKKAYENKSRFKAKPEWVPMRERLLRNIGRTKDESIVKFLVEEARRNPEAALQAAAGEALGFFEESDQKLRKDVVGDLLVTFGALSEQASLGGTSIDSQNARDRLAALSGKWVDTLKKLTRQNFDTFREWQVWYQKNKNEKW